MIECEYGTITGLETVAAPVHVAGRGRGVAQDAGHATDAHVIAAPKTAAHEISPGKLFLILVAIPSF